MILDARSSPEVMDDDAAIDDDDDNNSSSSSPSIDDHTNVSSTNSLSLPSSFPLPPITGDTPIHRDGAQIILSPISLAHTTTQQNVCHQLLHDQKNQCNGAWNVLRELLEIIEENKKVKEAKGEIIIKQKKKYKPRKREGT
jgi:hypothetical protein